MSVSPTDPELLRRLREVANARWETEYPRCDEDFLTVELGADGSWRVRTPTPYVIGVGKTEALAWLSAIAVSP